MTPIVSLAALHSRRRFAQTLSLAGIAAAAFSGAAEAQSLSPRAIQADPVKRFAADLVKQYYDDVSFGPGEPFNTARWAAWLAPDYIYVTSAGHPLIGKERAVQKVAEDFRAFSEVKAAPTVISAKLYGSTIISTVIAMSIAAVTTQGQPLGVHTTLMLNFHKPAELWQVSDEVVVPQTENMRAHMRSIGNAAEFLRTGPGLRLPDQ